MPVKALGSLSEVTLLQSLKAYSSTRINAFGSVREVRLLQPLNEKEPTLVNVVGNVRLTSALQPWNALSPTQVKDSGSVSEVSLLQFVNEYFPTVTRVFGSVTAIISEPLAKAESPMACTPVGTTTKLTKYIYFSRTPTTTLFLILRFAEVPVPIYMFRRILRPMLDLGLHTTAEGTCRL